MKLTEEQKAYYRKINNEAIKNADIELLSIATNLANEVHKKISDAFVPYIDKGRFGEHNKSYFIKCVVGTVAMIAAKEIHQLITAGFNHNEVMESYAIAFQNSLLFLAIKKDNPGEWMASA